MKALVLTLFAARSSQESPSASTAMDDDSFSKLQFSVDHKDPDVVHVSGKTYELRDTLRSAHGEWDKQWKKWDFSWAHTEELLELPVKRYERRLEEAKKRRDEIRARLQAVRAEREAKAEAEQDKNFKEYLEKVPAEAYPCMFARDARATCSRCDHRIFAKPHDRQVISCPFCNKDFTD